MSPVPALESVKDVLEESSKDLKNKGDGRKSLEHLEDMEKRLKEIWPLEEAIWSRAREFETMTNSSISMTRSRSNKSRAIVISRSSLSEKGIKKLCFVRRPGS